MEKHIITGGPCTGKTTLLNKLQGIGYETVPEAARNVIQREQTKFEQDKSYHPILPWTDLCGFQDLVIKEQYLLERAVKGPTVFADRSYIDNIAYAEMGGFSIYHKIRPYLESANYGKVFFLDQLNLYENDESRKEDREKAKDLHEKLFEVYNRYDYEIVRVPDIGKENRLEMVLNSIGRFEKTEAGVLVPT